MSLQGKVALVTGASRGIGAATALKLAALGADLVLNYRQKAARADEVVRQIQALGQTAFPVQADLTAEAELHAMMAIIRQRFPRLNILILNASGGMEKGKATDYATALNVTAQLQTAKLTTQLMSNGGRIVFVTSHWAHFYGQKPVMPEYEAVAQSKHAGECALRECIPDWTAAGISLVIVSGDAIEGTITPRLLARKSGNLLTRRTESNPLPSVDHFAEVIAHAAYNPALPTGHTIFVGSTDY